MGPAHAWPFGAVREYRRLPALAFSTQFFTRTTATGLVRYARAVVSPRVKRNARRATQATERGASQAQG